MYCVIVGLAHAVRNRIAFCFLCRPVFGHLTHPDRTTKKFSQKKPFLMKLDPHVRFNDRICISVTVRSLQFWTVLFGENT